MRDAWKMNENYEWELNENYAWKMNERCIGDE